MKIQKKECNNVKRSFLRCPNCNRLSWLFLDDPGTLKTDKWASKYKSLQLLTLASDATSKLGIEPDMCLLCKTPIKTADWKVEARDLVITEVLDCTSVLKETIDRLSGSADYLAALRMYSSFLKISPDTLVNTTTLLDDLCKMLGVKYQQIMSSKFLDNLDM